MRYHLRRVDHATAQLVEEAHRIQRAFALDAAAHFLTRRGMIGSAIHDYLTRVRRRGIVPDRRKPKKVDARSKAKA